MPDGSTLDISSLRTGDTFGAGTPPDVSLWCSAISVQGNILTADVINGAWTFRMDRTTGRGLPEPECPQYAGISAVYTGRLPRRAKLGYNEAISYMRERAGRNDTPDERILAFLGEVESVAFDQDGEPRDLSHMAWVKVTRQMAAIDAALAVAPDAPGAKALADLRAMAFTPEGLAAETPEAVDDIRYRVREALGMPEYEPQSACFLI